MRLLLQESHAPCVVPHNKNAHHVHFVRATHDRLSGLFADKCVAAYMPPPDYDTVDVQMADQRAVTPEGSMATESVFDGYDTNPYGSSRKRRRLMEDPQVQAENMHQLWAEELLDYFMLQGEADAPSTLPLPPEGANLDRAIDDKGHTALHWAVAMGDLEIVKRLLTDRASIDVQSKSGETPLMRSVLFTNIFEKQNMERIASLLVRTVNMQDWAGSTVFHHIANTTVSRKKYACARYYMDCILNKMAEVLSPDQIERILTQLRQRQIADEQVGTYERQRIAADKERELREAEARAKQQTAITESDVRMTLPVDNIKLDAQAQGYSAQLQGCLLARRCESFTVWGYTDKYSWVPGFFTGQGAANLLDANFQAKPAYNEVLAVLSVADKN